jgi:hypothetical protein
MKSFLVHATCDECTEVTYVRDAAGVKIWYHPDDPEPLSEVICGHCGYVIQCRIGMDHMLNLRQRGVEVKDLNDKFEPLTEEMIDEWDIDAELLATL